MYGIMPEARLPALEIIQGGLSYWEQIRAGRRMPARADLDPMAISRLLPYVMLVDVLHGPLDFRFRLLGTAHDRIVAGDYRGRRFSELAHTAPGNPIWNQYADVVRTRCPFSGEVLYCGPDDGLPHRIEHCLMPFATDGDLVDMIFVVAAIPRPEPVATGDAEGGWAMPAFAAGS